MDKREIIELTAYLKNLVRLADKGKEARINKAKDDFWYFIQTYFPHHIEHAKTETSQFRRFLHKNLPTLTKENKKLLFTAYRGGAKTTTITQLFTLWKIAKQEFRHGVLISASTGLAADIFEVFKTELIENAHFIYDFNLSLVRDKELTLVIKSDDFICKLVGYGAGQKIRGLKFLTWRPDYIIIDDLENDESVESKQQRKKLAKWFKKVVLKLPNWRKPYVLIVVGTMLHNDSLLMEIKKRKDFVSFSFDLVLQFPDDMDNEDNIDGLVLDDTQFDPTEIMAEYYSDIGSFMSEYQNNPISDEDKLIDEYVLVDVMPKCDVYYMGLDPAMGKKKGDYFGVAVIGKKGDKFYATVKGYRMSPVKLIPRIIATYEKYSKIAPTTMAVEVVQFQEFFKDVLKKEATAIGVTLAVKELRNTAPKALRIDSIAPLINDGTILIYAKDHLLIEELDTYPSAAHDDLLDSLEMAYRIYKTASTMNYKEVREKIKKRNFARFKNKYA